MRCAAARVVLVWWASQVAVEVAPDRPGMSSASAWATSRASSSASWAFAAWTSLMAVVVSVASIDHNGTPATAPSWSRTPAIARVTRCGWCAIAVMTPIQAATTDSPTGPEALVHKGKRSRPGVGSAGWLRGSRQARPAVVQRVPPLRGFEVATRPPSATVDRSQHSPAPPRARPSATSYQFPGEAGSGWRRRG